MRRILDFLCMANAILWPWAEGRFEIPWMQVAGMAACGWLGWRVSRMRLEIERLSGGSR